VDADGDGGQTTAVGRIGVVDVDRHFHGAAGGGVDGQLGRRADQTAHDQVDGGRRGGVGTGKAIDAGGVADRIDRLVGEAIDAREVGIGSVSKRAVQGVE